MVEGTVVKRMRRKSLLPMGDSMRIIMLDPVLNPRNQR
jgi:hypothetical protein